MAEEYSFQLISLLSGEDPEEYNGFTIKKDSESEFIETFSNLIDTILNSYKNNDNDIPLDNLYTFIGIHLSNPIIQNIVLKFCINDKIFFTKYKKFITQFIVDKKIFTKETIVNLLNSLPIINIILFQIMNYEYEYDKKNDIIIELVDYFEKNNFNTKELYDGLADFFKSDEQILEYFIFYLEKIAFDKYKITSKVAIQYAYILSKIVLSSEDTIKSIDKYSEIITDTTKSEYNKLISPWHKLLFFTNLMIYLSIGEIIKNYGYSKNNDMVKLLELFLETYYLTIKKTNNVLFEFVVIDCIELLFSICKLGIISYMSDPYYKTFDLFSNIIAGLNGKIANPNTRYTAVKRYTDILYYNTRYGILTKQPKNIGFAVLKYITDVKYSTFLFSDEILSHVSDLFKILKKYFIDRTNISSYDLFTFVDDDYDFDLDKIIPTINESIDTIGKTLEYAIASYTINSTNMFQAIMSNKYLLLINSIIDNMNIGLSLIKKFINNSDIIKLLHDVKKENDYIFSSHTIAGINLIYSKYIDICLNDKYKINVLINNNIISRTKYMNLFFEMIKIFEILAENKILIDTNLNIDILEKYITHHKLNIENYNLVNFINHKKDELIEDDLPEEFHDTIFMSVIKDPIMIPHSEDIHDKNSMLYYLSTNPINPLTREKLTVSDVVEYNKNKDILEKINEFIEKKKKYMDSKKNINIYD